MERNTSNRLGVHLKKPRHLKMAALLAKKKHEHLLMAEKIAQSIWHNYPSCTCHREFSPEYRSNPEYTLLGEIQILLGHCRRAQFFATDIVVVFC